MKRKILVAFLAILTCTCSVAQGQSCRGFLAKLDSNHCRTVLEEEISVRNSPCITEVIKRLGQLRDIYSIPLLVRYLDYMDPATAPRADGGADVRPRYPAVTALFLVGKPATRELLEAIQDGETEKLRENAVNAYLFVYRDDLASAIRLLKKQHASARSAEGRSRLSNALQKLIDDCNGRAEQEKQACERVTHEE